MPLRIAVYLAEPTARDMGMTGMLRPELPRRDPVPPPHARVHGNQYYGVVWRSKSAFEDVTMA